MSFAATRAILTGDIVASSRLPRDRRERLPQLLKEQGRAAQRAFPKLIPHPLQVFRGDSWQLLISSPAEALRIALFLRAGVIAAGTAASPLDTRIALAIGAIDFVPGGRVSEGDGPAYRASGAALDALREHRLAIVAADGSAPIAPGLAACVILLDALAQRWTARQAQAVQLRLQGLTQAEIAARWPGGIRQQSVAQHLARASWPAIEPALAFAAASLGAAAAITR